jgi:ABC-2 type transport system ATP-binding protein
MTQLLEVIDLTRRYGDVTAVAGASFTVGAGEIWGFIGPNGAGKTTTMRVCATLDLPDQGDVLLDGRSVVLDPRRARQRIGYMPDRLGAYSSTTVWEYLDFFGRCVGLRGTERADRIASVLDFTDMTEFVERPSDGLSKGMSQRLCLAKTLLHDPDLLILDEPAAGLDPRARVELRDLVRSLAATGKGVLISSHILSELSEVCDGVVVIERGRVVRAGSLDQLSSALREHQMLYVRTLEPRAELERALAESVGVMDVRPERGGVIVTFGGDELAIAALLAALVERGLRPVEFQWHAVDLEELFLRHTDGELT